ncbi:NAD-dependent epimerase [Ideonella sp. 4Y11]|uniref:NAD-dependent epimerase n=1 Tax=Ideonella aquatica TaxID=2824119 RepID=A0A940YVB3_9BURK|nr:NAD-dependent epimerase [Ideonella aquatica]MBQ0959920.1 NAD-dependent epimerase [Ideonella aquatica]
MRVLVTGAAGFIGMHLSQRLLARGDEVVGYDNLNPYYDPHLKFGRLSELRASAAFSFVEGDLSELARLREVFEANRFDVVINLAAQAGVRYSIERPHEYASSNLVGFLNLLEMCRAYPPQHLVYASSSSVYGGNKEMPFSEQHRVDNPVSLYAATKKSNELMAHTYSHLFGLPTTGLRFFTVYGPWGRPDMAYFLFTKAILAGEPIKVFNEGQMMRDFTYIDDIVDGVVATVDKPPVAGEGAPPYKVFNIGNETPVKLADFIGELERALGREAKKIHLPMQPGDVPATYADVSALRAWTGLQPRNTSLSEGIDRFAAWYRQHYGT